MTVIEPEEAQSQATDFINSYLVNQENQVSLGNIKEISGLYRFDTGLANGQTIQTYMTKDGRYFFSEGIDIQDFKDQQAQAQSQATSAQVEIQTLVEGEGEGVVSGNLVTVDYKGRLEDGTVFDSTYERGEPATFPIGQGQVIPGWEQGLIGMKVGEKRQLTIPPALAYGEQGAEGVIPPNATLIFEIELLEIR